MKKFHLSNAMWKFNIGFWSTGLETSKDGQPETKVSKLEVESPTQLSDKAKGSAPAAVELATQSSRATRRSKN